MTRLEHNVPRRERTAAVPLTPDPALHAGTRAGAPAPRCWARAANWCRYCTDIRRTLRSGAPRAAGAGLDQAASSPANASAPVCELEIAAGGRPGALLAELPRATGRGGTLPRPLARRAQQRRAPARCSPPARSAPRASARSAPWRAGCAMSLGAARRAVLGEMRAAGRRQRQPDRQRRLRRRCAPAARGVRACAARWRLFAADDEDGSAQPARRRRSARSARRATAWPSRSRWASRSAKDGGGRCRRCRRPARGRGRRIPAGVCDRPPPRPLLHPAVPRRASSSRRTRPAPWSHSKARAAAWHQLRRSGAALRRAGTKKPPGPLRKRVKRLRYAPEFTRGLLRRRSWRGLVKALAEPADAPGRRSTTPAWRCGLLHRAGHRPGGELRARLADGVAPRWPTGVGPRSSVSSRPGRPGSAERFWPAC